MTYKTLQVNVSYAGLWLPILPIAAAKLVGREEIYSSLY